MGEINNKNHYRWLLSFYDNIIDTQENVEIEQEWLGFEIYNPYTGTSLGFLSARHAIFYGSSRNYIVKLRDQRNEAFYAQSPAVQLLKMLKGSEVFNEVLHKLLVSRVTQFSTMASKRRYYDRQTSEKRFTFLLSLEAVFSCQIF